MSTPGGKVWATVGGAALGILASVFAVEGGYSNYAADPGGETNHGITVQVARDNGYQGAMSELPKELAQQIYLRDYIERPRFHNVIALSPTTVGQ